jgi:hypothetical protein
MRRGELPVADCLLVWNALVRSSLEYGAVWGDVKWEEAEAVQREMGRMILRCGSKMANEVVLGELGWWPLKARRDLLRLKYWGKIVARMPSHRLVKLVYADSRARYEVGKSNRWCSYTHALLVELGLEEFWQHGLTHEQFMKWDTELRKRIGEREEKAWKQGMMEKTKLRTYRTLKHTLSFEPYLTHDDRRAREVMTRLRGGTNELRIEVGRYPNTNRDRRLQIHERRCLLCMSGDVEDEKHFMLDCVVYDDLRKKLFVDVENLMLNEKGEKIEEVMKTENGRQRVFVGLMGEVEGAEGSLAAFDLRIAALGYCRQAMRRRNGIVMKLDQRS